VRDNNFLFAEMLSSAVGVRMNHIPYKGANLALTDIVGGRADHVRMLVSALPHVRAVVVTSTKRARHVPDWATMKS
jgi:tripartite-type tricarboxylate transporter receptor subunit TctC